MKRLLLAATVLLGLSMLVSVGTAPARGDSSRLGNDTPVVLLILDELPTASLMTRDGSSINRERFPNIAAFADGSTWYPDHASLGDYTAWAVPGILTGLARGMYTLPTSAYYPNSIFTLLGPGRNTDFLEPVTEVCPVTFCPDNGQGQVTGVPNAVEYMKLRYRSFHPGEYLRWLDRIPSGDGGLSVAHVVLPHSPSRFTPEGRAYPSRPLIVPTDQRQESWTVKEPAVAFTQQRHLIQVGYADLLIGRLIAKLKANGDYENAMVVITADHGVSFDPDDFRREVTSSNVGAIVNPPLFIKYPGQTDGAISHRSTQSIDILPTIAKQLGADIPPVDGVPIDVIPSGRKIVVRRYKRWAMELTATDIRLDRRGVLADQYRRLGFRGLWELGPRTELFGRRPGKVEEMPGVRYRLYLKEAWFRRADSSDLTVPSQLSGSISGLGENRLIAVAWNGRIVATTRTFTHWEKTQFGAMIPPAVMKKDRNTFDLYLVGPGETLRRIRPAIRST